MRLQNLGSTYYFVEYARFNRRSRVLAPIFVNAVMALWSSGFGASGPLISDRPMWTTTICTPVQCQANRFMSTSGIPTTDVTMWTTPANRLDVHLQARRFTPSNGNCHGSLNLMHVSRLLYIYSRLVYIIYATLFCQ